MAKKSEVTNLSNDDKEEKLGSTSNKIINATIVIVIVVLWLGFFAFLIKIDVGGFGSGVLKPVLQDVPIISNILPSTSSSDDLQGEDGSKYKSLSEANARIKELELQLKANKDTDTANSDYITDLEAEVERLKVFEKNQADFEKKVADFDKNVVFNDKAPDIQEYKKYYESLDPKKAEEIYRQVVEQIQSDKKVVEMAERYSKMEPKQAAQILEVMTGDLDLVSDILGNMKTTKSSLVLQEMTPEFSAKLTKKMSAAD